MEIHYEFCGSRLCKGIGEEISGEQKDKEKKRKLKLVEGRRQTFW
jgi:hypothetical protein